MALHVACRLTLMAFATAMLHGAFDGRDFGSTVIHGLSAGAGVFCGGLLAGELARRLIDDLVSAEIRGILEHSSLTTHHQDA